MPCFCSVFSHCPLFRLCLARPMPGRRSAKETTVEGGGGAGSLKRGAQEGSAGGLHSGGRGQTDRQTPPTHTHTHTHTMGAERKSLVEFVRYARSCYDTCRQARPRVLDVVIGNTGGDMDSVVSALGYSYLSYLAGGDGAAAVVLPVLSFARADLALRRDVERSLHAVGLRPADLIFADELAADDDAGAGGAAAAGDQYRVRLVDHNAADNALVQAALAQQRAAVVAVVDHHADAGLYAAAAPRVVRPCGSCSSLVLQHFAAAFASRYHARTGLAGLDGGDPQARLRRRELQFLVSALAVDTDCLQHRVEAADRDVYTTLVAPVLDAAAFAAVGTAATAAKLDIAGLSVYDLLRKDYKEYETASGARVGISSVACSLARLQQQQQQGADAVAGAVADWSHRRNLQLCVVMTSFVDKTPAGDVFRREIALAPPGFLPARALSCLKRELGLEAGPTVDADFAKATGLAVFEQHAVGKSRKAVAPLVVGLLQ